MLETIGDRIRQAREASGLSLRQVAKLRNCSHVWIGEMERGERPVPSEWIAWFAGYYGVSADFLLLGRRAEVPADIAAGLKKLPHEAAAAIRNLIGILAKEPTE